jgi:alginate O-acetyltransferase complex protein AlgI
MIFNSITFLLFFLVVSTLYWLLSKNYRLWLIFISSLIFYGFWKWEFLSLVLFSTILDFYIAKKLDQTANSNKLKRKFLLIISLAANLGLLIYFKYSYFIVENINSLFSIYDNSINFNISTIILPLGISFYTFQTISYSVDVYRRHIKSEKNFVLYACYVTFFPQLVAGPILRASEVMFQFSKRPPFKLEYISIGLKRIIYGFFLKVVLADNIAPLVNYGFSLDPNFIYGIDVWVLAFLFGFQIYFDFAGYSHIAIGCAQVMGIEFPENFNFPYAAKSFKSFWRRWHISLSSWIRDYLYLPISGVKVIDKNTNSTGGLSTEINQTSKFKKNTGLFLTWAIMGLWHGANWTFVFWGLYHAIIIFIERLLRPTRNNIPILKYPIVGFCITLPIAMLGWIPFRASNLTDTFIMFSKVFSIESYFNLSMRENIYIVTFLLLIGVSFSYLYKNFIKYKIEKIYHIQSTINVLKFSIMIYLIYIFFRPINQFIYFQF